MSYYREHGIPVKIIRIFNTYGPKMDINDGRVVSNFIVQALRGDNITIYGDGGQSRPFQYIDDLIEVMVRMMDDTPDDFTGPVNIGNPNEFTIAELAREVISLTGSKSKIVHLPLPADDPQQRQSDISLARNMLGRLGAENPAAGRSPKNHRLLRGGAFAGRNPAVRLDRHVQKHGHNL